MLSSAIILGQIQEPNTLNPASSCNTFTSIPVYHSTVDRCAQVICWEYNETLVFRGVAYLAITLERDKAKQTKG